MKPQFRDYSDTQEEWDEPFEARPSSVKFIIAIIVFHFAALAIAALAVRMLVG